MRAEDIPATEAYPRLGRRERLAVLAIWVALGLLEAGKAYAGSRLTAGPLAWRTVLVGNLPWWLAWAALTPIVITIARRWRFDAGVGRAMAVHVSACVSLSLLHHVVVGTLYFYTHTRGQIVPSATGEPVEMTLLLQFQRFFGGYFLLNVMTYAAIVIGYLGFAFFRRYRAGELRAARLEASMHEARLAALRMELNPHFLFNTLNATSGLVRRGEGEGAVRMLARLADLLRITLELGHDPEIPLEKELEVLSLHLEIERVRFGPRLTVDIDVDDDVRGALVPPLILQPLVENAVRHGIACHRGPGCLAIRVSRANEGERIEIAVTNSGPAGDRPAPARGNGVGLQNTRQRLAELYHGAASLELRRLPGGGATATIGLPLRSPDLPMLDSAGVVGLGEPPR